MSLYLVIDEPNKLGRGERILVDYKFFVLNNNDKTYVIFKEKGKELRAFSRGVTRRGLLKFLSLDSFNDPKNGYRDRDSCTIGAELLVSKPTRKKATLTIKNPSPNEITLNIQRFCTSKSSVQSSEAFPLEGRDWYIP
ncbi:hypothetical protein EUGRSUZ_L02630 [Eucalyptus grandis]|uniref:MATH domain-containing protein n=1 Tax=Eucalyptus grandis TaxID=71139 RepID=A0AAD9WIS4_EUCGR|nr:hypothetical protein EUGRSUZ_L02630 [Eucalyptus grandis]